MRVEYSAGLVARERSPSQASISSSTSSNFNAINSNPAHLPSPFLSMPSRKMSLDFAIPGISVASVTSAAPTASPASALLPLPAARLIHRPQTTRVFCVLQPDTLMAMYAAKEDARSCDSIILLGTRLIYLVQMSGAKLRRENDSNASTPSPPVGDLSSNSQTSSSETSSSSSIEANSATGL